MPKITDCYENLKSTLINRPFRLIGRHLDYGLPLDLGTEIVLFGEMSSGLMKQNHQWLAIMTRGRPIINFLYIFLYHLFNYASQLRTHSHFQ